MIRGELVDLRPLRFADVERSEHFANDPDYNGPFGTFGFVAAGNLRRRFDEDGYLGDDHGRLTVVDKSGQTVGEVSYVAVFHGPPPANLVYNIGIALDPGARGRGFGADALALLTRYLFQTYTVERVEASTDVENIAAQRALDLAGFTREGLLRRAQWRAGDWHDIYLYSKLRGD